MRSPVLGLLLILSLSGCLRPTYSDDEIVQSVKDVIEKEYKTKDLRVAREKNSLWIYTPVDKLVDAEFELDKDAIEKIGNVSLVSSRVLFSSDSDIEFIVLMAYDDVGIELKMIRHIEDIKKVRAWYIAYSDFYKRMDIQLGFSPDILGRNVVRDIHKYMIEDPVRDGLHKFFHSKADESTLKNFPEIMGKIKTVKTLRIDMEKALVYMETSSPVTKSLFLIDVEFFDILRQILILYLSKKDIAKEDQPEEKEISEKADAAEEKEDIKLPVVGGYWNLSSGGWPHKYRKYMDVDTWDNSVYSKEIDMNRFLADQIERRMTKRLEDQYEEWKIRLSDFSATYLREEILITREVSKESKPHFEVDIDHEILLIVAQLITNYNLEDVKVVTVGLPDWKERKVYQRREILKAKPKKWERIVEEEKDPEAVSAVDVLLSIFVPNYNSGKTVEPAGDSTREQKKNTGSKK